MYKIGFLDENKGVRNTFYRKFHKNFDVVMLDDPQKIETLDLLIDEIDNLGIDALAVDYRLADTGWISYNGDEVIDALWEKKRYFPVFMLTSYSVDAIQKMTNAFLVNDKEIFSEDNELAVLFSKIESSIQSYAQIIQEKEDRIREIEGKQDAGVKLPDDEERELLQLHVEMHAINPKENPITPDMMQTSSILDLRELVTLSREMLKTLSKED